MLSAKRGIGIERCIFEGPGPGLVNNKIRKSRHLQRSTPSVKVSVRTRNPRSDYPFTQFGSTILIVDNWLFPTEQVRGEIPRKLRHVRLLEYRGRDDRKGELMGKARLCCTY